MKMRILSLVLIAWSSCICLNAQLVDDFNPPPANCCLALGAKALADQLQDWNQLGRYSQADLQLRSEPAPPNRVVFMGDSITDAWKLDQYFPGKPYVNRGISGQTTPQMLVRMFPDVIDLKPAAMVILAGTNDLARITGPETAEMVEENIMAMTELAQRHGIKVILCSIIPVSDYPYLKRQSELAKNPPPAPAARPSPSAPGQRTTEERPPADILKINAWLKQYAATVNAVYVDYFSALVDEKGLLNDGYSSDGVHPNPEGYKLMVPLVDAAVQQAL
jgi:lysophospholipase L1-like esterase